MVLASLPLVTVSRRAPGRCHRGADGLGSGSSPLGEPPGQLGGYRGLVVSGAVVGPAVEDGVEGGLLGGDHLPQVLVDGAFGDSDVVIDGAVLADAVQPL